jgi:FKBP-type peptidyl-prolyl cis-trans isomerase FkpA
MKILPPLLLGWLLASGCATTSPTPAATAAAPTPAETAHPAPSAVAATQPQTEEQKTLYALGLNIGRGIGTLNLTAEELELVRTGIYTQVKGEPPAVDLLTYGPKIREFTSSRQARTATVEKEQAATAAAPAPAETARPAPSAVAATQPQTEEQKILYALGLNIGRTIAVFKLTAEELEFVRAGIYTQVKGEPPAVDLLSYGPKLSQLAMSRQEGTATVEKEKGKAFQDKAAQEPGAVRTESGLIYQETQPGTGASPTSQDVVKVHYRGKLIDGKEFDSSYKRGKPATFPLDNVIQCWTEGMQRMKVGGKARLVCPSDIAYKDRGAPPDVMGGATLVFEVELLEITKAP